MSTPSQSSRPGRGCPVCASETAATRSQFLDFLRKGAVDYVMLDVSWCGGLSEAKKIATMAEAFQRPVAPHDCTGPVVFAASIHLALNLPNAIFQESVRAYYSSWYRRPRHGDAGHRRRISSTPSGDPASASS